MLLSANVRRAGGGYDSDEARVVRRFLRRSLRPTFPRCRPPSTRSSLRVRYVSVRIARVLCVFVGIKPENCFAVAAHGVPYDTPINAFLAKEQFVGRDKSFISLAKESHARFLSHAYAHMRSKKFRIDNRVT